MRCTKCGEEWDAPAGKSHNFCPNCGNKVEAGKKAAANLDTAKEVLAYIAHEYGTDVLLSSKVHTYFADTARNQLTAENKLIKILVSEGTLDCLKAAIGKPETEQAISIKRAVAGLPFAKAEGEEMLQNFAAALGWKIANPQPVMPQGQARQLQTTAPSAPSAAGKTLKIAPTIGSIHNFAGIDWRVLAVENNKALVISEKVLEKRAYNVDYKAITWETSTLRQYLNGEFLNKLGAIKPAIAATQNNNPNNPWYGTAGGNNTTDKVFLLSIDEVVKYFGDSGDLANKRRKDSKGNLENDGYYLDDRYNSARAAKYGSEAWWWWLRSPGNFSYGAAGVRNDGSVFVLGYTCDIDYGGVRPALWLNL